MGRAAARKARNRQQRTAAAVRMRTLQARTEDTAGYRQHMAAVLADAELVARVKADLPGQAARLHAAGWRQARAAGDGAGCWDLVRGGGRPPMRLIHSLDRAGGDLWAHVSVSRLDGRLPTWEEIRDAQWLCHPDGYGVIVVAPASQHVNLAEVAHVWTRLTGGPAVPDFTHGLATI